MRTIKYRETLPTDEFVDEKTCIELGSQNHSKVTIAAHSASTNTRITIYYLFEENGGVDTAKQIQQIDLTQNVLTVVNFDMKLHKIRITRDDTGSELGGGDFHLDATAAK